MQPQVELLVQQKSSDLIWPIWDSLNAEERADVFRYLVIWDQGGRETTREGASGALSVYVDIIRSYTQEHTHTCADNMHR